MIERCFKTGVRCALEMQELPKQVFVGMPFKPPYKDLFDHGMRQAIEELELTPWIAYDHKEGGDLFCKICQNLQRSCAAIIDVSEPNPNVHFELGILAGLSKPFFLTKQEGSPDVSTDLEGLECARYSDIESLRSVLKERLTLATMRPRTHYATHRLYYKDMVGMLGTAHQTIDLTHIREEPPSEFEGASDWFEKIVMWADEHPSARLRRIISVSNERMRVWASQLLQITEARKHANFEVRVCDWRASFPAVNLTIFDRQSVFVALTGTGATETAGFNISEHAIANYFVDYYNNIWANSVTLKKHLAVDA